MKAMKRLFALMMLSIMSFPYMLKAQDEGTYIDNLNVQDSSYMDQDLLGGSEGSSNTTVIIIVAVVVVLAVVLFVLRKRKKK